MQRWLWNFSGIAYAFEHVTVEYDMQLSYAFMHRFAQLNMMGGGMFKYCDIKKSNGS